MKRSVGFAVLLLSIWWHTEANAACIQDVYQIAQDPNIKYNVEVYKYDDYFTIEVNGKPLARLELNKKPGNPTETINVSDFFDKKRLNTVKLVAVNRAWNPAVDHEANPGLASYWIAGTKNIYTCSAPDWRENENYPMFEHNYTFVNQSFPDTSEGTLTKK